MKTYETCEDVREEFSALLDGELAVDEQDSIENHLADCSDCLRALDGLKRVNDLYAGMPAVSAPDDFDVQYADDETESNVVDLSDARGDSKTMTFRPLLAAAAMLAILAGVSYTVSNQFVGSPEMELASVPSTEAELTAADTLEEARTSASADTNALRKAADATAMDDADAAAEAFAESAVAEPDALGARDQQELVEQPAPPPASPAPSVAAESPASGASNLSARQAPSLDDLGFSLKPDGVWYEAGFTNQPITHLERGTDETDALLAKRPDLTMHLRDTDKIVFRIDGAWYRLATPPGSETN